MLCEQNCDVTNNVLFIACISAWEEV